jgi:hypothetical protein
MIQNTLLINDLEECPSEVGDFSVPLTDKRNFQRIPRKKKYQYLQREIDRHGNVRFYVRPNRGKRIRIDETLSAADFGNAYAVALAAALKIPEPEPEPPPTKPKPKHRFVYVVTAEGRNKPAKVGIATNPLSRLRGLKTGNPEHLRIFYLFKMAWADASRVEANVKHRLRTLRVTGEWLDLSAESLIETVRKVAKDFNIRFDGVRP